MKLREHTASVFTSALVCTYLLAIRSFIMKRTDGTAVYGRRDSPNKNIIMTISYIEHVQYSIQQLLSRLPYALLINLGKFHTTVGEVGENPTVSPPSSRVRR